mmetsp:Transcript_11599/g.53973  ORF Transcript_11599/g.53973 Transcript_11599/m.53973 type:complete len:81 (+) Transcript_11599:1134-1376(+)
MSDDVMLTNSEYTHEHFSRRLHYLKSLKRSHRCGGGGFGGGIGLGGGTPGGGGGGSAFVPIGGMGGGIGGGGGAPDIGGN